MTTCAQLPRGRTARAIAAFLRAPENVRLWWSPKELADALGIGQGTVRKELRRIEAAQERGAVPVLSRGTHGLYRAFLDAQNVASLERPELVAHALQLSSTVPLNKGWGPPAEGQRSWGGLGAKPTWARHAANGQFVRNTVWRERLLTVAVSPGTGTVQVSLRASHAPLRAPEFEEFNEFVQGLMAAWGLAWLDPYVDLNNVEFNLDYRTLFLAEARRVGVKRFRNAWVQAYQKTAEIMRVEARVFREGNERVSLGELASMFQTLTTKPVAEPGYAPGVDPYGMEVA